MSHTVIRPGDVAPVNFYQLLNSAVVPRPVGWISTHDVEGHVNLAPYSLITIASSDPFTVVFTSLTHVKDTAVNAISTGCFTVNIPAVGQIDQVNATSETLPSDVDEAALAGVELVAGSDVECPRIKDAPVALECTTSRTLEVGNSTLIFGEVQAIYVREDLVTPKGTVNPLTSEILGKLGGPFWTGAAEVIELIRPDMVKATK